MSEPEVEVFTRTFTVAGKAADVLDQIDARLKVGTIRNSTERPLPRKSRDRRKRLRQIADASRKRNRP